MLIVLAMLAGLTAGPETRLLDAVKGANRDAVRALVAQGLDVNAREADGTTALHWAVRSDDLETVKLLIRAGANVNASNRYGVTPLGLAATNGSAPAIAALLDAGADANATVPAGETALMTAVRTGNPEAVRLLLAHGADVHARESEFGENALMWAAAENHPAVVALLVSAGADLNRAAKVLEFPKVKVDAATMVVTALPRGGLTPLMYAARQGALEAARALVDAGADLNLTDPDGTTSVVMAIINAHYELAAMLADKGANLEAGDASGMAALYATVDMHTLDPMVNRPPPRVTGALDAVDLVKVLLAHHANPNAALRTPLLARQHNAGDPLLGAGATPLMRAAKNGDVALMRLLVAAGADPNRSTRAGRTPLLFAIGPGRRKSLAETLDAIAVCLNAGADVNARDDGGQTPLHAAVAQNQVPAVIRLLAERGAALDARDKQGRTPLDIALAGDGVPAGRGRGGRGNAASRDNVVALLRELMGRSAGATPTSPR